MKPTTLLLIAALLAAYTPARAGWTNDPINGMVPVCTAPGNQIQPSVFVLGQGNIFIAWADQRNPDLPQCYYQVLNSTGDPILPLNGRTLIEGNWIYGAISTTLPDGDGGCIKVFIDKRSGYYKIYGQRFDSQGNRLWGDTGLPLAIYPGNENMTLKDVACDSLGNFFVAWAGIYYSMIFQYVQKFTRDGERLWGEYGACTVSGETDDYQQIVPDGQGGVMDAWQAGNFLRFQHLDAHGNPLLAIGGIQLLFLNGFPFYGEQLWGAVQDGYGGAVFVTELEYYMGMMDMYMIRVNGLGTTLWNYTSPVHSNAFCDLLFHPADSSIWLERYSSYTGQGTAYIHKFTPQGVSCFDKYQTAGAGYKMVSWREGVITAVVNFPAGQVSHLIASKVHSSGRLIWRVRMAIGEIYGGTEDFNCIADEQGGMICAFEKFAGGYNRDIYAQRINPDGSLGSPPTAQTIESQNIKEQILTLQTYGSGRILYSLSKSAVMRLELFNLLGRRIMVMEGGLREPGNHEMRYDYSHLTSGIYLLRLTTPEGILAVKTAVVK